MGGSFRGNVSAAVGLLVIRPGGVSSVTGLADVGYQPFLRDQIVIVLVTQAADSFGEGLSGAFKMV